MSFGTTFSEPFYTGTSTLAASIVPGKYPAALGGRAYLLDLASNTFRHRSIPLLKPQQDTGNLPGEHSLNPEGVWRVAQETWHKGAGQTYIDKAESDPARFRSSKGVDIWTKWQMSLLQATAQRGASAELNQYLAVAGPRLYRTRGTVLEFTTDPFPASPSYTTVTGMPATPATSLTTDGNNILTAHGTDGIYRSTKSISTTASYITGSVTLVAYVKDRIMAAFGPNIYNIITAYPGPAALPSATYTHRNADFTWVGFAEGQGYIYAAGFSGDKSQIFKTAVVPDGTTLAVPTVAGELPDGEIVRAIQGYLSYILIGTDLGLRFARVDANGNLVIGSLIRTTTSVKAFEPQDRFVWFGWSNYDGASTGLGRLDLSVFNPDITGAPAYASDLMATGQGEVVSIVTFSNRRIFTVAALGTYVEDSANKVTSGTLDTGLFTFSTPETKTALLLDVWYQVLTGTHAVAIAGDDGVFTSLGSRTSTSITAPFTIPQLRARAFELRHTLTRDGTLTNTGPVISRHTIKGFLVADSGYYIFAPFLLTERDNIGQQEVRRDPAAELDYIKALRANQSVIIYQEGAMSYSVLVDDFDWQPTHLTRDKTAFNGTCLTKLRLVLSGN